VFLAVPDARGQNGGMTRFIVVPQWQGSPSSRAMTLIDGADAIAGDLPRASCSHVDVPLEAGDEIGTGIHRASSLIHTRRETIEHITGRDETPIVIGGDAGVSVWAIDALAGAGDLAVAWFGAGAPLETPESSETGAFERMALSAVLGRFESELALARDRVAPGGVVLAGVRDDPDPAAVAASGVSLIDSDALDGRPEAVADAIGERTRVFVHISLDVLDPAELAGVAMPAPFGVSPQRLGESIAALRTRHDVVGASITGFAPPRPAAAVDDLGTILRVVSALTKKTA